MNFALFVDGLFEGGRMFAGAISTLYLLSRGITLTEVGLLKSIQMTFSVILESPTGVIADTIGHRWALFLSTLFGAFGFLLFSVGNSFGLYLLAEICIAICLSFWSGAYEAFSIDDLKIENDHKAMDVFFHRNSQINSLSVVVSGFLGSIVFKHYENLAYLPSLTIFIVLACLLFSHGKSQAKNPFSNLETFVSSFRGTFKSSILQIKVILSEPHSAITFISMVVLFAVMQPIIYYWQVFFEKETSASIETLGIIFGLMNLTIVLASGFAARLKANKVHEMFFLAINLVAFSASTAIFSQMKSPTGAILAFCVLEAFFVLSTSQMKSDFNKYLSTATRASAISVMNLVSKLLSFGTMALSAGYLETQNNESFALRTIFIVVAIAIALVTGLYFAMRLRATKRFATGKV